MDSNKHYIKVNAGGLVQEAFSDAFRIADQDCICINEDGGRHLNINGISNPPLKDNQGFCLFKWDGSEVIGASQDEQAEVQALVARDAFKSNRNTQMLNLTVQTQSGKVFDADEVSQGRMSRAIQQAQLDGSTETKWGLANNTSPIVTLVELQEALKLSLETQSAIWFQ